MNYLSVGGQGRQAQEEQGDVSSKRYFNAMKAYRRFEIEQAEAESEQILVSAGCPFAHLAAFYKGVCQYYRKELPAAEHSLAAMELLATRRGYVSLAEQGVEMARRNRREG